MPHRPTTTRRITPRCDRGSFEWPNEEVEDVTNRFNAQFGITPTVPRRPLEPQNEGDEDYSIWLERYPDALQSFEAIEQKLKGKRIAVFLDYDGTLTPIVRNPDRAIISEEMRMIVRKIAELYPTAIISGRGVDKVQNFVRLETLFYAGSHGLDIRSPMASTDDAPLQPAAELQPLINTIYNRLREGVMHIQGANVEHNTFCLSVHFRNCHEESWDEIRAIVKEIVAPHEPRLKMQRGRKVLEIRPGIDWHKGKAVEHLLKSWSYQGDDVVPVYLGDDRTDEDAFHFLKTRAGNGIGVLVSSKVKQSEAHFSLRDPAAVQQFLTKLAIYGQSHHRQES